MHTLKLEDASINLIEDALSELHEIACEDADEGRAEAITALQDEIKRQTSGVRS